VLHSFVIALILATGIIYLTMLYVNISGKNIVFKPGSSNVIAVYDFTMLAFIHTFNNIFSMSSGYWQTKYYFPTSISAVR